MRFRHCIPIIILIALLLAPMPPVSQAQDGGTTCEQLVRQAVVSLGTNCANLGPNSLCYGYEGVEAELAGTAGPFDAPGQRVSLADVTRVTTAQANPATGEWGIAVLNVQANLHSASPKMATYYLLGDVEITNAVDPAVEFMPAAAIQVTTSAPAAILKTPGASGKVLADVPAQTALMADGVSPDGAWVRVLHEDVAAWVSASQIGGDLSNLPFVSEDSRTPMQEFTFRTGGAASNCPEAPPSVLVVQSPLDTAIDITANGVDIRVGSVVFLRSQPNGDMELTTSDGAAVLYPGTARQTRVPTGGSVTIPAGGMTWRNWRVPPTDEWNRWGPIGNFPPNVGPYPPPIPIIICPSGVGAPPCFIVTPGGPIIPFPPKPPNFPGFPPGGRGPGRPLPVVPWPVVTVGGPACPAGVLYHSDREGTWDVYMLSGVPNQNVSRGENSIDMQPSISPDGEWAAFTSDRDNLGGWEVFIARIDGTQTARLTFNSAEDINPVWGPDSRIIFESDREGNWDLFMVDVATNDDPVQITDDEGDDILPFWAPDGESVFFQSNRNGVWGVYELDIATGDVTRVISTPKHAMNPIVSHDGKTLAWLQSNAYGTLDLWIKDLETREVQQLTDLGTSVGSPSFAPDDSFLAFHAALDDNFDVFVVDIASGTIRAMTTSEADDYAPAFICGSPVLVYHSDAAATEELPGQRQLFQIAVPPLDQPALAPTQLTADATADNVFPMGDPREEINSRLGM